MKTKLILSLLLLAVLPVSAERSRVELKGVWHTPLGNCRLPGTTDESKLGDGRHPTNSTFQLTRLFPYSGQVTYTKEVVIPRSMSGKHLSLTMERTKPSTLWVDGDSIGSIGYIYSPHVYVLPKLRAGKHTIKIRIDNSATAVPREIQSSHAWTDGTQTNWNGILGEFYIEAREDNHIESVQIYPDVANKTVRMVTTIHTEQAGKGKLDIMAVAFNTNQTHTVRVPTQNITLNKGQNSVITTINMGDKALLWSEFHPALYKARATLTVGKATDEYHVNFGMRHFNTEGTQFVLNGKKTFMRGRNDACVFPLTGYAPMDVESWQRVFQIAKSYGINYYRCHSYTPPRAAFEAADLEGIYIQAELPLWGRITSRNTALNTFLLTEAQQLLNHIGNHPSFMMFALGNELTGEIAVMRDWLNQFRQQDTRHLYSFGSNNNLGRQGPQDGEDYFTTCRMGNGPGYSSHVRASFAYADADKGGILNNTYPGTLSDYSAAIRLSPRPVVSHETGQFQIYPDYKEIAKYTGVLYPYNLRIFRDRLKENGLTDQIDDFHQASGRFAVECYKADIEYYLRTPGIGGFQMLDLQDFPGQGSALIGILDAFMDSKGICEPSYFKGFCAPVVPLAKIKSRCWASDENMQIEFALTNYTENDWADFLKWSIRSDDGLWGQEGVLDAATPQGQVRNVGYINLSLKTITKATHLTLYLTTGEYQNSYNLWVYPATEPVEAPIPATHIDNELKTRLDRGETVLLLPDTAEVKNASLGALFTPDYWNYAMFKGISEMGKKEVSPGTLSLLMNPKHPLFAHFPTAMHSDWQWWALVHNSRPLILDATHSIYKPIIQVVDNVERNHKLGLVFEFAVGRGKLMVCMFDLHAASSYTEGRAFRDALYRYMQSPAFAPVEYMTWDEVEKLFHGKVAEKDIRGVENNSDYIAPNT